MFTGIVSAVGAVAAVDRTEDRLSLRIEASGESLDGLELGESIAVDGACLTIVRTGPGWFQVDAVVTTRGRTRFGEVDVGDRVNLERAMAVGDRVGGHFVQGHVDGVGEVRSVRPEADALLLDVAIPQGVQDVTVLHGSITLNGVSLTVNAIPAPGTIQVALIPYTRDHTTLGQVQAGDRVHVEGDMLGKFVRQLLRDRGLIAAQGNDI